MSIFDRLSLAPADPILGITEKYQADPSPDKVNLGVGVYLDRHARLPLCEAVQEAEKRLVELARPRNYLPIEGMSEYIDQIQKLIFSSHQAYAEGRILTVQSLSGTGALKLGADLLAYTLDNPHMVAPSPSWANHRTLFERAGFNVATYRYYDASHQRVDVDGLIEDLTKLEKNTVAIFHACCHNPTGYDLTHEQWDEVIDACLRAQIIPFVDMAYQGFAEGLYEDCWAIHRFIERCPTVLLATSFSKIMGLYGERVGSLSILCRDHEELARVRSQLKIVIRTNYSNPPTHGASVVATVLSDPQLRSSWEADVTAMRQRIKQMRQALRQCLEQRSIEDMGFITDQVGMFSYCGLTSEQMRRLRDEFSIYALDSSRICMAGINESNCERIADAIAAVRR